MTVVQTKGIRIGTKWWSVKELEKKPLYNDIPGWKKTRFLQAYDIWFYSFFYSFIYVCVCQLAFYHYNNAWENQCTYRRGLFRFTVLEVFNTCLLGPVALDCPVAGLHGEKKPLTSRLGSRRNLVPQSSLRAGSQWPLDLPLGITSFFW